MEISDFQQIIADRYGRWDSVRGISKTFMWFVEEIGELSTALVDEKASQQEKASEFADVFAWLCTLANIAGVDIEDACLKKYHENCPKGFK